MKPAQEGTSVFVVPTPEAALHLLALAREQLGEMVSAFELIAGQTVRRCGPLPSAVAIARTTRTNRKITTEQSAMVAPGAVP